MLNTNRPVFVPVFLLFFLSVRFVRRVRSREKQTTWCKNEKKVGKKGKKKCNCMECGISILSRHVPVCLQTVRLLYGIHLVDISVTLSPNPIRKNAQFTDRMDGRACVQPWPSISSYTHSIASGGERARLCLCARYCSTINWNYIFFVVVGGGGAVPSHRRHHTPPYTQTYIYCSNRAEWIYFCSCRWYILHGT